MVPAAQVLMSSAPAARRRARAGRTAAAVLEEPVSLLPLRMIVPVVVAACVAGTASTFGAPNAVATSLFAWTFGASAVVAGRATLRAVARGSARKLRRLGLAYRRWARGLHGPRCPAR